MRRQSRSRVAPLKGTVRIPGDKSITHRALILAALAKGRSQVARPNLGDDVGATARVLTQLGAVCELDGAKSTAQVEGMGWEGLSEPAAVLDAGNSGTTMRMVLGVCAGLGGSSVLTGDESLRRRPMLRVVGPLRQMGATIDGRNHGDLAPLHVRGGDLEAVEIDLPVASAQVKSALLLAGLRAGGTTTVSEPRPSRDHTERMLESAGVEIVREGSRVAVRGGQQLEPFGGVVPGDVSSAMFLVAAACVVPGSSIEITDVGLNPTRTAAFDVLRQMGAAIEVKQASVSMGEVIGTISVQHRELQGVEVAKEVIPALIDEIPALAIVASQAEGETVFTGAGELRVKESDRVAALVDGLTATGGLAEELEDGLIVRGPTALTGGEIDPLGDHRIALSFAVAALIATGALRIHGWSCVDTSFPEFLDVLGEVGGKR